MTYAFVTSVQSGSGTISYTINSGESLVVIAFDANNQNTVFSVSDNLGNIYSALGPLLNDTFFGATGRLFYCQTPTTLGAATITVTNANVSDLYVYTGLGAAQPSAYAAQFQSGVSGTDSCTSGSITPTSQPALLFGFCASESSTLAGGTGFTTRTDPNSSFFTGKVEDKRLTATSATAATFTPGASVNAMSFGAVISEAAAADTIFGAACL